MIYLDTSVALAHLLAEERRPPDGFWRQTLISSRLLEYEIWNRIHARKLASSHEEPVRAFLAGLAIVEMTATALARALEPFPIQVRTLDALHLASLEFLRGQGHTIELATYDNRLAGAAKKLKFALAPI